MDEHGVFHFEDYISVQVMDGNGRVELLSLERVDLNQ